MQNLPIDTSRIQFVFSGKIVERMKYVKNADGQRVNTGQQDTTEDGRFIWTVDVFPDDDEAARAEAVGVTVPAYEKPDLQKFRPVEFENLRATIYVDRNSGRANVSLKADGIVGAA